ncbi:hypothetical protein A2Z22_03045 [Candidatus Woesebacteria bacterium RBG_16_34_12]|uniref:M23ase beta-sheet core domain-containing protein n=1 Tax=Candidatus Woesebacteria bacterium RBG_16_34_12 TaxID=1802480 RepID=A0A1F7X725_9BACT|nr:MAG: hypothetical protein A2Z22_03045 [Candidatus Woesebacteria bacterium RBG_16_34_12]
MIHLSINLPTKYRLDLKLVKRRDNLDDIPLFPNLGKIRRIKKGNKTSRFFRHIFENKKINRMLGTNLVIITLVSSLIPQTSTDFFSTEAETTIKAPVVLTTEKGLRYPLDEVTISQGYKFYHPGIDLDSITGTPVFPILGGKVEAYQFSNYAYGNAVLINHGNDITSLYAHLSKIFVTKGQDVTTNAAIGTVGATGQASGDHLHLEIRENGKPINPLNLLPH